MSEASTFFKNQINNALLQLNTAMPCRVISFDEMKRKAKVQPLFMTKEINKDPDKLPVLENAPLLKHITTLENGDIVLVVFCQRAIDNVMSGQTSYPGINRHHSLNDGVIVGVIG